MERLRQKIRRRLAGSHPRAIDRPHPLLFLKTERPDPRPYGRWRRDLRHLPCPEPQMLGL